MASTLLWVGVMVGGIAIAVLPDAEIVVLHIGILNGEVIESSQHVRRLPPVEAVVEGPPQTNTMIKPAHQLVTNQISQNDPRGSHSLLTGDLLVTDCIDTVRCSIAMNNSSNAQKSHKLRVNHCRVVRNGKYIQEKRLGELNVTVCTGILVIYMQCRSGSYLYRQSHSGR